MFALVVAASLAPNTGAVPAQTSCPYGVCQSSQGGSILWEEVLVGLAVLAGILAVPTVLRRRRRQPPAGPVEPWGGAAGLPPGAAAAATPPAVPPPAGGAPYVETPEDVGQAAPEVPPPPAEGEAAEPDIDSLMKELDRISGEILKRSAPKTPPQPPTEPETGPEA